MVSLALRLNFRLVREENIFSHLDFKDFELS